LLKHLAVAGKADGAREAELREPKVEDRFKSFSSKGRADGERAGFLRRHPKSIMKHCAGEAGIHPDTTKMNTSGWRNEWRRGSRFRGALRGRGPPSEALRCGGGGRSGGRFPDLKNQISGAAARAAGKQPLKVCHTATIWQRSTGRSSPGAARAVSLYLPNNKRVFRIAF